MFGSSKGESVNVPKGGQPAGNGPANRFPSAPGSMDGGFGSSPIMNRLLNPDAQDVPGFSMKQPGVIGLLRQQGQWAADRQEVMTPSQKVRQEAFRNLANGPAPAQFSPISFGGGSSGSSLDAVIQAIMARQKGGM
jgi:hypothetical protein